jgi:hypothetical protein
MTETLMAKSPEDLTVQNEMAGLDYNLEEFQVASDRRMVEGLLISHKVRDPQCTD